MYITSNKQQVLMNNHKTCNKMNTRTNSLSV